MRREVSPLATAILAMAAGAFTVLLLAAQFVHASGGMQAQFDQLADCPFIAGWEVAYEPVSAGGTVPGTGALGASFPNSGTCGPNTQGAFQATGVGPHRFWLRAVAGDGTLSPYSNSLDVTIPFAAPILRAVGSAGS